MRRVSKIHRIELTHAWEPAGPNTWKRRFGRPSGLEKGDRVWLVLESPPACGQSTGGGAGRDPAGGGIVGGEHGGGEVTLNGVMVDSFEVRATVAASVPRRAEISPLLRPRNELVLTCGESPATGASGGVPPAGSRHTLPRGCGRVFLEIEGAN